MGGCCAPGEMQGRSIPGKGKAYLKASSVLLGEWGELAESHCSDQCFAPTSFLMSRKFVAGIKLVAPM